METTTDTVLAQMTLEAKVGQVMGFGFDGVTVTRELRAMIRDLQPGSVVIFGQNVQSPQQLAQLTADLQRTAQKELDVNWASGLIISIDQEGGRIARLRKENGFAEFPSAQAVGASNDPAGTARDIARALAVQLKAAGINMDLAPVLDVNNNPGNKVIGDRSFGADPAVVSECGVAFIRALQAEGIMAVGKHFPGHGDTTVDSHVALPVVAHDRARLEAVEFVPFKAAIAAGVAGIMSAHVAFPAIEPTPGLAGTLSSRVMTRLLRDEMGFRGLRLTDSLDMGALKTSGYPVDIAAALALKAGADLLLMNCGHELNYRVHATLLDWIKRGDIPQARLDQAVRQVLAAKERYGILGTQA